MANNHVKCLVFDRAIGLRELLLQIGATRNTVAPIMRCIVSKSNCIDFTNQYEFVTTYKEFMDALETSTCNMEFELFKLYLQSKYITKTDHLFAFVNYKRGVYERRMPFLIKRQCQYTSGIRSNKLFKVLLKCAPRYFVKNLEKTHFEIKIPKFEPIEIDVKKEFNDFIKKSKAETNTQADITKGNTDVTKPVETLEIEFSKLKRTPKKIIIIF